MEVDSEKKPKRIDDFGDMSQMLSSMESKISKQLKHENRVKQHEKARQNE